MALPELRKGFALTFLLFAALILPEGSSAFTFSAEPSSWRQPRAVPSERLFGGQAYALAASSQDTQESEETTPLKTPQETKVCELLKDLHESKLPFRIVVVGNGAILESTNLLGPTFKVGESPKTGASIVTFAAEDQSFEFHLMPAQIASCVLVERPNPKGKILRLLRLLNGEGGSVCSLILADDSVSAQSWYGDLTERYGSEIVF